MTVLLYDADCGFCLRSVEAGRRLGCRYDATPFQTWPHLAEHGITLEAATDALHAVDGDGVHARVYVGHEAVAVGLCTSRYAVVRAAGRVVGSRALAPVSSRAYRWVADHRSRLPGGTPTCALEENSR